MDLHWISLRFSSRSSLQRRFRLRNTAKSLSWRLGAISLIFHRFLTSPRPFNSPAKRVFAKAGRVISWIPQEISENAAEPLNAHPNEQLFLSNSMKFLISHQKQVEQWFLTIPHNSFRLCFALRMERSVDSHETIHFFLKLGALQKFPCIPPLNSPAFWAVQEITWPPRIHRFLGIEQKPRTRVTEFH